MLNGLNKMFLFDFRKRDIEKQLWFILYPYSFGITGNSVDEMIFLFLYMSTNCLLPDFCQYLVDIVFVKDFILKIERVKRTVAEINIECRDKML